MSKKDESREKIEKLKDEIKEIKEKIKQKRKPFWKRDNNEKEEIKKLKESIKEKKLEMKNLKKQIRLLGTGEKQEEQKEQDQQDPKGKTDNKEENDLNDEGFKENQIIAEGEKEKEEAQTSTHEFKLTLTDWQRRAGIEIVPDDYIRFKNSKFLTEQEFRDILQYENVPKIVREPGSAEKFLKTQDDWNSMRTSMDTLKQAIRRGDFPKEVDDNDYILLQYSKDEIRDETGDGRIGWEDIDAKMTDSSKTKEIEEKIPKDSKLVSAKEVYDRAILEIEQNALTESILNDDLGVGEVALATVLAATTHDLEHDNDEIETGNERDEEGEEIPIIIDTTRK